MQLPFEVLRRYSSDTLRVAVFKSQASWNREPFITVCRERYSEKRGGWGRSEGRFFPSEEKAVEAFEQFVRADKKQEAAKPKTRVLTRRKKS